MEAVTLSEVFSLPVEQRIRIVQAIWDSLASRPDEIPVTPEQKAELDRCYAEYLANPDEGSQWADVKARLLARG